MWNSQRNKLRIESLYPWLSIEEQNEAEENLRRYLSVVRRIFDHVEIHNPRVLTELRRRAKVRKEKALR